MESKPSETRTNGRHTRRQRRQSGVRTPMHRFSSLSGSARRWIDVEDYDAEPANDNQVELDRGPVGARQGLFFRIPDTF